MNQASSKKWQISDVCPGDELIKYTDNLPNGGLLANLLAMRGIVTAQDAKVFLNPLEAELISPDVFCDMPKAVSRLIDAIKNKEHILIWGDFDADGVTSTALLHKTFTKLGANFSHFIPEREAHGHGLNSQVLVKLISKSKVKVVVTVDCAISDIKQIAMLKGLKVDVIITDHHKAPDILPEAYAIINPCAQNALSADLPMAQITSLCDLAGVGVAHKLALSLLKESKVDDKQLSDELYALVAIGTISDVVPLLNENRTLVAKGLRCLNSIKGVELLFKECKREGQITSTDVAFILTPRINAVGRLSNADEAFNLLVSDNRAQLTISLEQLNNNNKIRQSLCDEIFQEAMFLIDKSPEIAAQKAIVLFKESWHLGIVGIVASRLVDVFNKPVFLATLDSNGTGRLSARGVLGYNIYEIMQTNEELFLGYGGHSLAGGLSFDPKEHPFDTIRDALIETFNELPETDSGNTLEIDTELEPASLTRDLIDSISLLEPCGQKNPSPLFCIKDASLTSYSFVGKESSHLKYFCKKNEQELSCVWWGRSDFNIPTGSPLNIAFSPRLNVFNGVETIQLDTCDIQSEYLVQPQAAVVNKIKFFDHRHKTDILPQIDNYLSNPDINLSAVVLRASTAEMLKPFEHISKRLFEKTKGECDALMFFDYPASGNELKSILENARASKIHLMREDFEEDIDFYVKKLSGMLKFISNKKDGELELLKITNELALSENFLSLALQVFCDIGAIKFLSKNKIVYVKPALIDELTQSPHYEALLDEFEKNIEFKNMILYSDDYQKLFI